jgi:nucleotide-binding universal stress UspA family protein
MTRILVGLDGSVRSPGVLAAALLVGRAQGATLTLLRSVGLPPDLPQDFWKTTEESLLDVLRRQAGQYLDAQARQVPTERLGGTQVVIGVAWQAICEAAHAQQADLIVIGSHGYSGFDRLLGTTAAKVVNHAPCSVLVVREPQAEGGRVSP